MEYFDKSVHDSIIERLHMPLLVSGPLEDGRPKPSLCLATMPRKKSATASITSDASRVEVTSGRHVLNFFEIKLDFLIKVGIIVIFSLLYTGKILNAKD